jgi:cardiolipin synthase A/B
MFKYQAVPVVVALCLGGCGWGCGCGPTPLSLPAVAGTSPETVGLIVAPEDGTTAIVNAIGSARRRVLMEMYMLTASTALYALVAAHAAGADVRVLLEPAPYGDAMANQPAYSVLAANGIDVRWMEWTRGLVHSKLIVVDDTNVFVMTLNLTMAGLERNREYAVADADVSDLRWAERIWNADALGGDPGISPGPTRLLTSPIDARPRLAAAIGGATTSIAIEIEEFSDAAFVNLLITARGRGVATTVVAPAANQSAATAAALKRMSAAGVVVRVLVAPTVHAKAMVIDERLVYVGSVNFTRASLDDNREFGLLLDDAKTVARIAAAIAADGARGLAP